MMAVFVLQTTVGRPCPNRWFSTGPAPRFSTWWGFGRLVCFVDHQHHPEMFRARSCSPVKAVAIALLLIPIIGCTNRDAPGSGGRAPQDPEGDRSEAIDPRSPGFQLPNELLGHLTVRESRKFIEPRVIASDLDCAEAELNAVVHYGTPAQHQALSPHTIQFTRQSYEEIRNDFTPGQCEPGRSGLAILYGFDPEAHHVVCAFSFVCMDLVDDIGPYTIPQTPLYTIQNNALTTTTMTLDQWWAGPGQAFQENIVVDKYDNNAFQSIYTDQRPHVVYKLEQVDSLIADNHLGEADRVEVVLVAEPEAWSKLDRGANFSMKTCLVAVDQTGRLIGNEANNGTYAMRGADLGSACPPMCADIAVFQGRGVDVRAGCN